MRPALRAMAVSLFRVAGVRGAVTFANVALFALLGIAFGADAVGHYATYLAFVMISGSLMAAGLPQMLMRRAAISANRDSYFVARLRSAFWLGWLMAATVGTLIAAPAFIWLNSVTGLDAPALAVAGPAAYASVMMVMEELRGRGRPEAALLREHAPTIIVPFAAVAASTMVALPETKLIDLLVYVHLAAATFVSVLHLKLNGLRGGPSAALRLLSKVPASQLLQMGLMRFLAASAGYMAILLVSINGDAALAGLITVILKLTGLASTLSAVVNSVYAARFGAAYRNLKQLRVLTVQTATLNGAGVVALLAPMIIAPSLFLEMFSVGRTVTGAETALQIVAGTVLLRGFAGTPDLLFLVTGKAWIEVAALIGSLCVLGALVLSLPAPSAAGIAGAIAASQIVRLILSAAGIVFVLRGPACT